MQISNEQNVLMQGFKKVTGITSQQRGTSADPLQINPFLIDLYEDGFSLLQIHSATLQLWFCLPSPSSPRAREAREELELC